MEKKVYPKPLVRVTGGLGGEAVLILGSEKTALHDLGMACFNEEMLANLENALNGRTLDYVLMSHTHYDHMMSLLFVVLAGGQILFLFSMMQFFLMVMKVFLS